MSTLDKPRKIEIIASILVDAYITAVLWRFEEEIYERKL